ncbi:MAG: acyl-ACP desaturase [Acidimicrobiales bacterium]|nr:acyl-ACP desaturase [Acidimicrobiales bacterium]
MVISADVAFLAELESEAERLLERHLSAVKEWHPHTLVPYSRGEDFEPDYEWSPADTVLSPEAQSALFVNLLTEDNLPYYFRDIERMFGRDGAWGEWVRRWTAEEGRHAIAIRDYLTVTRSIDPVALERARMIQMSKGEVPEPPSAADGMCYVTLQELATRISHRNTGTHIEDKAGYNIMRQVAIDENHHFLFYRDIASAGFRFDPSQMMKALERQLIGFAMPGTGIPDFAEHSKRIAAAGIYDLIAHFDKIIEPVVLREWKVDTIEGLDGEAEAARERVMKYIDKARRVADRMRAKREAKAGDAELVTA